MSCDNSNAGNIFSMAVVHVENDRLYLPVTLSNLNRLQQLLQLSSPRNEREKYGAHLLIYYLNSVSLMTLSMRLC